MNWDTGNAYLAGAEDPYEALDRVVDHVPAFGSNDKDVIFLPETGGVFGGVNIFPKDLVEITEAEAPPAAK